MVIEIDSAGCGDYGNRGKLSNPLRSFPSFPPFPQSPQPLLLVSYFRKRRRSILQNQRLDTHIAGPCFRQRRGVGPPSVRREMFIDSVAELVHPPDGRPARLATMS